VGDDVELYTDESRAKVLTTFLFFAPANLKREDGTPNWCLADFCQSETSNIEHRTSNVE